jgi:signal transduction histidine kinase
VRLVGDIIRVERIRAENLHREEVDIHGLVSEVVAGASIAYDKQGINLSVKTPEEPCYIEIDVDRINQVLDNLINNAVKYSQPGNFVNITSEITVSGDFARISVEDEGPGIPADKKGMIFERYVQVKGHAAVEQGLGLGLAIAKQIIKAHGGDINVDSEVGKGSVFYFTLPL